MPTNGEMNHKFGVYKTLCCGAEIVINPGAAFPDCPNHHKLTTIWKPIVEAKVISQTAADSRPYPANGAHIENRRLFNVAAGWLTLELSERDHLHGCKVCQGVLSIFMNQAIGPLTKNPPKSTDAA